MEQRSNVAAVISYITWIGFIVALCIRDPKDPFTSHHINQALVLNLAGLIGGALAVIPVLGAIVAMVVGIGVFVLEVMGVIRAATWSMEPLPIISDIHLIG